MNKGADQKTKDAAYAFLSYMNQSAQSSVDVTIGATGYNPYRLSQLSSPDLFVKAGMPKELAENYIGAINGALNSLNMASDMKIPGAQKYTSVVLETELARYLAGEISVDEALENIEEGWEEATEDFGRDEQIAGPGSRTWQLIPGPMSTLTNTIQPGGGTPAGASAGDRWREWVDRHAGIFFIAPAVTLILIFAIFPTIYSMVFAVSRVRFTGNGLKFRYVGLRNFEKQFFGSSEVHFLGWTDPISIFGTIVFVAIIAAVLWWLYKSWKKATWVRFLGRSISAAIAIFLGWLLCASLLSGNAIGTLYTTLFYVLVGCGVQFVIGTGLAFLCSQPIRSRNFFRVLFFIPLMVTPLGVGFAMRMIADVTKGPFEPILGFLGLQDWVWSARFVMMICDSWQRILFIFICMLAALENVPRDHVEAAQVDGASILHIFREVT